MKFAKFLLNLLLWCVTFVLVILAQYSITALICLQGGSDVDRVRFAANEEQVSYFDAPAFMVADLKEGYKHEDPYWVRSWFGSPDWWADAMKWADVSLGKVTVTLKAIFVPVMDIRDLRDMHIEGYYEITAEGIVSETYIECSYQDIFSPEISANDYEAWQKILASDAAKERFYQGDIIVEQKTSLAISELNLVIAGNESVNEWIDEYPEQYKFIRLSAHYNTDEMNKYYSKFINSDGNIKFEAVSVYIHYVIALVLSCFFVHNNKFRLKRTEDGENEVQGGYRMPGFGKRKKKKKTKSE